MDNQYHEIGEAALKEGLKIGEQMMKIFSINEKEIKIDINITNLHEGIDRVRTSTEATGTWSMISSSISNGIIGKIYQELNNNNISGDVSVHVSIEKEN